MLAQMEVYRIREMREKQGKGLREISRETGYAFKMVKKYADKEDFSEEIPRRKKGSKLDPYKPEIDQWLEEDTKVRKKQRHTAVKVYNRLKSAYKDFPVGERKVRSYVRAKKRAMNSETGYIKLSHPGGEAQVDFGQADFLENGKTVKLSFLVMTYPHSNGGVRAGLQGRKPRMFFGRDETRLHPYEKSAGKDLDGQPQTGGSEDPKRRKAGSQRQVYEFFDALRL